MSRIQNLLADLYSEASEEGNQEVIDAISHLAPLDKAVRAVDEYTDLDDNWEKLIIRESYSSEEISALFSKGFLSNPLSNEILEKAVVKAKDQSKTRIAVNMLSSGMTESLLRTKDHWNPDLVKEDLDYRGFSVKNYNAFQARVPHPGTWNRSTLKIFEMLDIDMPDDYDPEDTTWNRNRSENWWTPSRMDACDTWVGEIVDSIGVPTITMNNGNPAIINSALAIAFLSQHEANSKRSKWHQDNFPNYLPVLVTEADSDILEEYGALKIEPCFKNEFSDTTTLPHHGFKAISEAISEHEVAKSLSLLSLETVESFRSPDSDKSLVLIPSSMLNSMSMELRSIPEDLITAIRYHSPDYLYSMINEDVPVFYMDECTSVHPHLYFRGLPLMYMRNGRSKMTLDIVPQLIYSPIMIDMMNSPEEIEFTKQWFSDSLERLSNSNNMVRIFEKEDVTLTRQILDYKERINKAKEKFGEIPALYFVGSKQFLDQCAIHQCYTGLESHVRWRYEEESDYEKYFSRRTRAQLGCLQRKSKVKPEMTLPEIISTGTRSRDDNDIAEICGVIDRYPIEEVGQAVKTEAQANFLLKHYFHESLLPHVDKKITKKIEKALARKQIESDLGL